MTVTWIQLNSQLLRLTGDARYGHELERSYYNHLAAAQRPDGAQWCYYTALEGTKPYGPGVNCCVSSGPRGMALAPTVAYLLTKSGNADCLAVNLFETSSVTARLGGQQVTVEQKTEFPLAGSGSLVMRMTAPATFALKVRVPGWAAPVRLTASDQEVSTVQGWAEVPARQWKNGDTVELNFTLGMRMTAGLHSNKGRACLRWGPIVLAFDAARNPGFPPPGALGFVDREQAGPFAMKAPLVSAGSFGFETRLRSASMGSGGHAAAPRPALFVPFAEAGATGGRYQIWLRAPGAAFPNNESLLAFGVESRSRAGNVNGSIADGDPGTFVVTFDGRRADLDWFALALEAPVTIRRVVYAHGHSFHDGGWFDSAAGKPRVQIQRVKNGAWETVGTIDEYPATSATDSRGLKDGQKFTLRLKEAVPCVAVRLLGKPAHGDNPAQAFSSCAELEAFP